MGADRPVFSTRHGAPVEPRNLARTFDLLCERSAVRRIRLQDTRHTCASLLAAAGTHPRTIMATGHSQIGVTMNVYADVTQEAQREALRNMDRLLGRRAADVRRGCQVRHRGRCWWAQCTNVLVSGVGLPGLEPGTSSLSGRQSQW
jgi:hypothetical protein